MPAKAKLPPGTGKRVPLNMRTTQKTRNRIEKSAADSGRSLVQEVEYLVEKALHEEDALDRESGGKDMRGLFRMMVGAREFIEANRGAAANTDWATFHAVKKAWDLLIFTAVAPRDQTFSEYYEDLERAEGDSAAKLIVDMNRLAFSTWAEAMGGVPVHKEK